MGSYRLSKDADLDLEDIAKYTLRKWSAEAFDKYKDGLEATFEAIGTGKASKRKFSDDFPELLVTRYRHHYVFYFYDGLGKPSIIGVIHERRDIVNRLRERLA